MLERLPAFSIRNRGRRIRVALLAGLGINSPGSALDPRDRPGTLRKSRSRTGYGLVAGRVMRSGSPPERNGQRTRVVSRHPALLIGVCISLLGAQPTQDREVGVLVLKEHGVGSPTLAQPYVERFVGIAAQQNGWPGAKGQYFTSRAPAEQFIAAREPHYGILSLAAFLDLREKYRLDVIGRVVSSLVGGQQYFVVSRSVSDTEECKGKRLASDHTDDPRFVERVIARGAFRLSEFTVIQNQRPLLSLKQVITGEADCALIDDAQLAELAHLEGGRDVKVVWKSRELPAMTVVAFPAAPAAERKKFQQSMSRICAGDGQTACGEVGIRSLEVASTRDYAELLSAYGK